MSFQVAWILRTGTFWFRNFKDVLTPICSDFLGCTCPHGACGKCKIRYPGGEGTYRYFSGVLTPCAEGLVRGNAKFQEVAADHSKKFPNYLRAGWRPSPPHKNPPRLLASERVEPEYQTPNPQFLGRGLPLLYPCDGNTPLCGTSNQHKRDDSPLQYMTHTSRRIHFLCQAL